MATAPLTRGQIPKLFNRITSRHDVTLKHFKGLREDKEYRDKNQAVLVQGVKTVQELHNRGMKIKTLALVLPDKNAVEVAYPASMIVKNPKLFPAHKYYLTNINLARYVLGTASVPGVHDIFAEVSIPSNSQKQINLKQTDKLLIFDGVSDPGNLGTLVRTAHALDWKQGFVTTGAGTCDLYNDKVIRASRALSLNWQHEALSLKESFELIKEYGFTPLVADMLPDTSANDLWSPEHANNKALATKPGTGVWFWNFQNKPPAIPKKMALILSSEHHGTSKLLDDEIRVSVPMNSTVESLNVSNAGCIIMDNLNRYSKRE
jgi:TrmH family RNA methyltransferase